MKRPSRKVVFVFLALACIGAAGAATAASVVAHTTHAVHQSFFGSLSTLLVETGAIEPPVAPPSPPESRGGCGGHHWGDGW